MIVNNSNMKISFFFFSTNSTIKINNGSLFFVLKILISEKQAQDLAKNVSIDKMNFSISFNEFLKLMSLQQEAEPDTEVLLEVFM